MNEQRCVLSQNHRKDTITKWEFKIFSALKEQKKGDQNLSVRSSLFFPVLRSSQRSSNRSTMKPWCSRERPRSTMTPTETSSCARWMTSRWVTSSKSSVTVSGPAHLSYSDAPAAQETSYNPTVDFTMTAINPKIRSGRDLRRNLLSNLSVTGSFFTCFSVIFGHVAIFVCVTPGCGQESQISRQRRTVVPSVPQNAEKEARSLFAKEVQSQAMCIIFPLFARYCVWINSKIKQGNKRSWWNAGSKVLFGFKGQSGSLFHFCLFIVVLALILLSVLTLTVYQDVQHRLACHQLQIRGLLWGFPPVAEVKKMSKVIFGLAEMINPGCACRSKGFEWNPNKRFSRSALVWNKSHTACCQQVKPRCLYHRKCILFIFKLWCVGFYLL